MRIIGISSDHNGVELKGKFKEYLNETGHYKVIDLGPFEQIKKVDYVDYANQLSQMLSNNDIEYGILICGTGVGMSIAANRFENVRAALVHNTETAPKCREHNNSNMLCLGAWTTTEEENFKILDLWLSTEFGHGRHVKRVEKLSKKKKSVVFTNGVFDILHIGHVELLRFSKSLGDKLVVAINSDQSVRDIKGPNRPVNRQEDRKKVLEAIEEVDEVIIFNETDTKSIISEISPSVVVKGGEWTTDEVRERDEIPKHIDIKIFPFIREYSTTGMIKKIHEQETWKKNAP